MENYFEVFPWNHNLETGIQEIDEQHKKLVELLNNLANTLTQEEDIQIEEAFTELAKYAQYHFESEELIWKKYFNDNELFTSHKDSHSSFLPKVIEIKEKNNSLQDTIEEIVLFLIRWLAFHIIDEDKRLALIIEAMNKGNTLIDAKYISNEIMSGSMKVIIDTILLMYDELSLQTISLIKERKARLIAERELKAINIKLQKLSITDQLTGLYNRRYFEEIFKRELQRAKRSKSTFNLIILDIDYFKKLNDTYRHQSGDKALKALAKCLKNITKRASDFAFRIGGEEFAIINVEENRDSVINIIKILQNSIKDLAILNENSISKYLTISAGIISIIPSIEDNIDTVMKKADDRLYEAKERGRNNFVFD